MMTAVRKHSLINSCYNHMMIVKKLPQHQQKRYLPTVNIPQPDSSYTGPRASPSLKAREISSRLTQALLLVLLFILISY